MKKLVLTNSASGSGCLYAAGLGNVSIAVSMLGSHSGLTSHSVIGPLPNESETADFFGPKEVHDSLFWQSIRAPFLPKEKRTADWLMGILELSRSFDSIECWFDPNIDGQINLVHLLEFIREDQDILEKMLLVHPTLPVGNTASTDIATQNYLKTKLDQNHLVAARRFWTAYKQQTPQAFALLLDADLSALPYLGRTVPRLLAELPSVEVGLGQTEVQILKCIARSGMTWHMVFHALRQEQEEPTFSLSYAEDVLERLADSPNPAISGLMPDPTRQQPFDPEAFDAHRQSRLSLTALGQALVAKQDDFFQHNSVHRWWGNTELTNQCLWRWSSTKQELVMSF